MSGSGTATSEVPGSLLAATAVMPVAALLAIRLPARRASRVDPREVMRAS